MVDFETDDWSIWRNLLFHHRQLHGTWMNPNHFYWCSKRSCTMSIETNRMITKPPEHPKQIIEYLGKHILKMMMMMMMLMMMMMMMLMMLMMMHYETIHLAISKYFFVGRSHKIDIFDNFAGSCCKPFYWSTEQRDETEAFSHLRRENETQVYLPKATWDTRATTVGWNLRQERDLKFVWKETQVREKRSSCHTLSATLPV